MVSWLSYHWGNSDFLPKKSYNIVTWAVGIAPWFCLCLPSCSTGFESQVHHLCFFKFIMELQSEKDKHKWKRGWDCPHIKKTFSLGLITLTLGPVPGFIFWRPISGIHRSCGRSSAIIPLTGRKLTLVLSMVDKIFGYFNCTLIICNLRSLNILFQWTHPVLAKAALLRYYLVWPSWSNKDLQHKIYTTQIF